MALATRDYLLQAPEAGALLPPGPFDVAGGTLRKCQLTKKEWTVAAIVDFQFLFGVFVLFAFNCNNFKRRRSDCAVVEFNHRRSEYHLIEVLNETEINGGSLLNQKRSLSVSLQMLRHCPIESFEKESFLLGSEHSQFAKLSKNFFKSPADWSVAVEPIDGRKTRETTGLHWEVSLFDQPGYR
jgi:hypothetical protein